MRMLISSNHFVLAVCILCLGVWCCGQADSIEAAPMQKAEQAALYSAIQGFVGNWWNGSDLYPDPCGWTPIQALQFQSSIGDVSPFLLKNMHGHGLHGQLPTSFGYLTKLQSLVLLENGLTGELPTTIGNLTSLNRLVLGGNRFTGQIPDSFGRLKEPLISDSSRNSLSGNLASALGGLTSLLKLDLSNNQLEGKLLGDVAHLKNLTLLDLRNNKLSGGLSQSVVEIHSLEELVLSRNPIGEVPESLSGLKRLRFLGLGVLKLSEDFYGKMGRRFGAWNNPNLCYPVGVMTATNAACGVKPCQRCITLLEPNSSAKLGEGNLNRNSHFIASLGFSSDGPI
ncbi:hypothetical protein CRYUN_Cryun06bG0180300 [Craigia yunnanensis]